MIEKLNYSGGLCSSGILVQFSGVNLALDQNYTVSFKATSSIPGTTSVVCNPTGYVLSPSNQSPILITLVKINSSISDNSSINLINLSVYDSSDTIVYNDYKSIVCANLCGSGVPITPTPTVTPTFMPTPTPTPTPAPEIPIKAIFDKMINILPVCNKALVSAKAYGILNQTYRYSFGSDMSSVDLNISNPSGYITLLQNPTTIYTTITLPEQCKNYVLEFGLFDEQYSVQSAAAFRCGNC